MVGNTLALEGKDKLRIAIVQIGALLKMTDMVRTNKIKDQALFDRAVAGFAQASVDLQNSLDDRQIKDVDITA
jgi:hypothetical protein